MRGVIELRGSLAARISKNTRDIGEHRGTVDRGRIFQLALKETHCTRVYEDPGYPIARLDRDVRGGRMTRMWEMEAEVGE